MSPENRLPAVYSARSVWGVSQPLLVLIEVPEARVPRPRLQRAAAIERGKTRHPANRPCRRRLRREVRLAACALLGLGPIFCTGVLVWSLAWKPSRLVASIGRDVAGTTAGSPSLATEGRAAEGQGAPPMACLPAIVLSIEPGVVARSRVPEDAVVFPGYLLPDYGREESSHDGD